jgi:putative endonuclease
MESFWVYMVLCSDASYYTGITNDVDNRVAQHNEGIDKYSYTFTRRPVRLVYTGEFNNPNDAIAFEKQLKGWSRKKKEALIRGDWDAVKSIARR